MGHRDPQATRRLILEIGQEEAYLHGFQGASLGGILRRAGLTKGAFFHHFPTKTEFGYAIVEEILAGMITAQWVGPLRSSADPLETIAVEFERGAEVLSHQRPILGCPLNNLAQEMNPLDDGFRARTSAVFDLWRDTFRHAIDRGQRAGIVRSDIEPSDTAYALVAQIEGTLSLARNSQDPADLAVGTRGLRRHLASMRADPTGPGCLLCAGRGLWLACPSGPKDSLILGSSLTSSTAISREQHALSSRGGSRPDASPAASSPRPKPPALSRVKPGIHHPLTL